VDRDDPRLLIELRSYFGAWCRKCSANRLRGWPRGLEPPKLVDSRGISELAPVVAAIYHQQVTTSRNRPR
jgi:hypothetical protein